MVDSLARLLHRLVTQDQDIKNIFTKLFIDLLKLDPLIRDTRNVTQNAIHSWATSQRAIDQVSELITKQVLMDNTNVRPTLQNLLINYLKDDFENVASKMEN